MEALGIFQARDVVMGNLSFFFGVPTFFFPHDKSSARPDQICNGVFQRKHAIALTLPTEEGCCPTKILLIDSLLGCQLQHGYFLKIIDQSTKSSLSPVRVLQICMGKVCQLQGSGNCTIMSPK